MIVKSMIMTHMSVKFAKKHVLVAASFAGLAAYFHGLAAYFARSYFLSWDSIGMFGISLPSRTFSSKTLMDGESVIASQHFSNLDDDALMAELQKLEDCMSYIARKALHL